MDRKIPIYFDTIILDTPIEALSQDDSNAFRLEVAVFTKYKNRNGSYITDEYAELLIKSATRGNTPVVGFFDPESQTWASHTGPTLANGYGYVENFLGWQPFTDTDGVTRDYAVFSVVLFTKYYEEAKKIRGQHQSMELDEYTINGDWANFDGEEYFVYTSGDMLGLCVIGSHEPCFSVSSFFAKNDDTYKSQYEKFSSLLFGLKAIVEEAEKNNKGGEQPMNEELEKQEVIPAAVDVVVEETPAEEFEVEETNQVEEVQTEVVEETQPEAETETEEIVEDTNDNSEFELLQHDFEKLQASYNQLQQDYTAAQAQFETEKLDFAAEIEKLNSQINELTASLASYEAQAKEVENEKKNNLIEKYEKVLSEEEIKPIREKVTDFSYDELEAKLAIMFANNNVAGNEVKKIPVPEHQESQFALLMEKYRKN